MYFHQLAVTKEIGIQFNRFLKIAGTETMPSDEILAQLEKKLDKDLDFIAPRKYALDEISGLSKKVIDSEKEINNAITLLSEKQEELADYLVRYNNFKSEKRDHIDINQNNFLESE